VYSNLDRLLDGLIWHFVIPDSVLSIPYVLFVVVLLAVEMLQAAQ